MPRPRPRPSARGRLVVVDETGEEVALEAVGTTAEVDDDMGDVADELALLLLVLLLLPIVAARANVSALSQHSAAVICPQQNEPSSGHRVRT